MMRNKVGCIYWTTKGPKQNKQKSYV